MKWIVDINLTYHSITKISRIWVHPWEYLHARKESYYEIRIAIIDDPDDIYYVVDKLYMTLDNAHDYLSDMMIKIFGKENLLFVNDD